VETLPLLTHYDSVFCLGGGFSQIISPPVRKVAAARRNRLQSYPQTAKKE